MSIPITLNDNTCEDNFILTKLIFKGYKSFKNTTTFEFDQSSNFNSIAGKNGSGKSSFAEIICLFQKIFFLEQLHEYYPQYYDRVFPEIYNDFKKNFNFNQKPFIEIELTIDCKPVKGKILIFNSSPFYELLMTDESKQLLKQYWNINNPQKIIIYIQSNKFSNETKLSLGNIKLSENNELNMDDNTYIIINMILFPKDIYNLLYNKIINDWAMERIIPQKPKKDQTTVLTKLIYNHIMDGIKIKNISAHNTVKDEIVLISGHKDANFDFKNLSSGEKTLFYLLFYINLCDRIGILIIDELENHFHEDLLSKVFYLLHDLLFEESFEKFMISINNDLSNNIKVYKGKKIDSIFFITHSKYIINSISKIGKCYLIHDNSFYSIQSKSIELELQKNGLSLLTDKVVFVEGETEIKFFKKRLEQNGIRVETMNSKDIVHVASALSTIDTPEYLNSFLNCIKVLFIIDRDSSTINRIKHLEKYKNSLIVLEKHEIENYLLDIDIWDKVIKEQSFSSTPEIPNENILNLWNRYASESLEDIKKTHIVSSIRELLELKKSNINHRELCLTDISSGILPLIHVTKEELDNIMISTNDYFKDYSINALNTCPGKQVYNRSATEISKQLNITPDRFKTVLEHEIIDNENSLLNTQIIDKILNHFKNL